jgi:hypothetical protein
MTSLDNTPGFSEPSMGPPDPVNIPLTALPPALSRTPEPDFLEFKNREELKKQYDGFSKTSDLGFFQKLGTAFEYETVIGEIVRDVKSPWFYDDPDFYVTNNMLEEYAPDIPEEAQRRVAEISNSFPEFLHEVQDVRNALEARKAIFSGGTSGAALGFIATLVASGLEATALTPLLGPFGYVKSGATATKTATKLQKTLDAMKIGWVTSDRAKSAGTGAVAAMTLDIPLEFARYSLDRSLTPADALFAIGASGTLSSGLGAAFPNMYRRSVNSMMDDAAKEQVSEILEETGNGTVATLLRADPDNIAFVDPRLSSQISRIQSEIKEIRRLARVNVRSNNPKQAAELRARADELETVAFSLEARQTPVERLTKEQIESETSRFNINTRDSGRFRSRKALLADIEESRSLSLRPEMAKQQITRNINDIDSPVALRRIARQYGVKVTKAISKDPDALKDAIIKAVVRGARRGKLDVDVPFSIPKNVEGKAKSLFKNQLKFSSSVDEALYRVGSSKNFEGKDELIALLKEYGISNPETLGKALRTAAREKAKAKQLKGTVGGTISVDSKSLLQRNVIRRDEVDFDLDIDDDILFDFGAGFTKDRDVTGEVSDISTTPEVSIVVDGKVVSTGPDVPGIREHSVSNYREELEKTFEEGGRTPENAPTRAEAAARRSEGTGGKARWLMGGSLTKWLNDHLTPVANILLGSKSPLLQRFARVMMQQSREGGINVHQQVELLMQREMNEVYRGFHAAARSLGRKLTDDDFRKVTRLVSSVNRRQMEEWEEHAVNALENFYKRLKDYGNENGLKIPEIENPQTYVSRIWDTTKFVRHDEKELVKYFTNAILDGHRIKGKKIKGRMAKEAARRIVSYGSDPVHHRSLHAGKDWMKVTRQQLSAEGRGFTEEEIDDIIDLVVDTFGGTEPHHSFAKRRIELNENYSGKIRNLDGELEDLHIDSFMIRDFKFITATYAHRVIGAAETRKAFEALGYKPDVSISTIRADIVKDIKKSYRGIETESQINSRIEFFDHAFNGAYRRATGQSLYDASPKTMNFVLGVQSFAQGTIGQFMGIAQLPEIASVLMRSSLVSAIQALPALRTIANTFLMGIRKEKGVRGADGRLLDKVAAELETAFAVGGDFVAGDHFSRRLDELGFDASLNRGYFGKALELGRQTSLLNPLGIMPMDTFMRRWATRAHFQNFVNQAYAIKNGKGVVNDTWWKKSKTRFKQLGLDDNQLDRIFKELQRPEVVTVKSGMFGDYKVVDIDFDKVVDKEAYDLLATAMRRAVDSTIQRQSFGELPLWMSGSLVAKMFTQYRVFSIASRGKQLAAGISRADATEAINFMGSAALGYMGFQLMLYGRSFAIPEEEQLKFWEENSGWSNALKSGFMRSSYATVLPMIIDTVGTLLPGVDPVFNEYMRTTGLGVDPWNGSIPGSLYNRISRSINTGANLLGSSVGIGDYEFKRSDANNLMRSIWATRVPVIAQGMDRLTSTLPN